MSHRQHTYSTLHDCLRDAEPARAIRRYRPNAVSSPPASGVDHDFDLTFGYTKTIEHLIQLNQLRKPANSVARSEKLRNSTGVYMRESFHHAEFGPGVTVNTPDVGPLSIRAWCLQERLLATRILHFRDSELSWECRTAAYCQCGLVGRDVRGRDWDSTFSESLKLGFDDSLRKLAASGEDSKEFKDMWMQLVHNYTTRLMSHGTDRLAAISGIAKRMQEAGAGEYLGGMWKKYLREHLTWRVCPNNMFHNNTIDDNVHTRSRHGAYMAPSWSWASVTGPIFFSSGLVDEHGIGLTVPELDVVGEIIDVEYEVDGLDATGSLRDAVLTIRAPVLVARLGKRTYQSCGDIVTEIALYNPQTKEFIGSIPDYASEYLVEDIHTVMCVQWTKHADPAPILAQYKEKTASGEPGTAQFGREFGLISHFLVVRPSPNRPGTFQRVGLVDSMASWETDYLNFAYPGRFSEHSLMDTWFEKACIQTLKLV